MDTIRYENVMNAVRALGFNPLSVDHITVDPDLTVSTRTRSTDRPLAAIACQHLGFPAEDVLSMEFEGRTREVRVTLIERDEHGNRIVADDSFQTRTEVCNY